MASGKRKRTKKTSRGLNGGGGKGRPLTGVEKVLMGGGLLVGAAKRTAEHGKAPVA